MNTGEKWPSGITGPTVEPKKSSPEEENPEPRPELPQDPDELRLKLKELEQELKAKAETIFKNKQIPTDKKIKDELQAAYKKWIKDLRTIEKMRSAGDSNVEMTKKIAWMNFRDKVARIEGMIENLQI
ncbi:MAG: hypothetical protein WAV15_01755 [Minisyncoccia bacterium]